jgi:hypothetical protein
MLLHFLLHHRHTPMHSSTTQPGKSRLSWLSSRRYFLMSTSQTSSLTGRIGRGYDSSPVSDVCQARRFSTRLRHRDEPALDHAAPGSGLLPDPGRRPGDAARRAQAASGRIGALSRLPARPSSAPNRPRSIIQMTAVNSTAALALATRTIPECLKLPSRAPPVAPERPEEDEALTAEPAEAQTHFGK